MNNTNLWADLPEIFTARSRALLGGEAGAFLASFRQETWRGLRANRLKISAAELPDVLPFPLAPVRWCAEGFTYPAEARPAKSWAYRAGLFYIQEPSAMGPAALLDPQPGERVLDLCAAPGGKSAQLAGGLNGQGLLVSNDASASRCRALIKNLEMAGAANALVINEQPYRLAERFADFFDAVLVDAPCSGEGMFRRDPDAVKVWAANKPESCAKMQREILYHAAKMVRRGGRLVYSTCTFGPEEDEKIIKQFLSARDDFYVLPIDHEKWGVSPARPEWAAARAEIAGAARIWPHISQGEGHFMALLGRKADDEYDRNSLSDVRPDNIKQRRGSAENREHYESVSAVNRPGVKGKKAAPKEKNGTLLNDIRPFKNFVQDYLLGRLSFSGEVIRHERSLLLSPAGLPDLRGLRVARGGLLLGDMEKERFVPSQALAMALTCRDARFTAGLSSPDVVKYLRGESVEVEYAAANLYPAKAFILVCAKGYPLGWAKWVDGRLKNQLPAGWVMSI